MSTFVDRIQSRRINGKYSLIRKIGEGGYGVVYLGQDFDTGSEVALKMEHKDLAPSFLANENDLYTELQGCPGFPNVEWYGWQDDYLVLVLELLGPNLEDLFAFCGGRFSVKTTLMVLDQLLQRFETLHTKGFLHRDVKPGNFLMGTKRNGNTIYMTDFGLVQEIVPHRGDYASRPSSNPRMIGTVRFASIRAHRGQTQAPWSDLESLGYMAAYFLQGQLPWQGLPEDGGVSKNVLVMEMKESLDPTELFHGFPDEFSEYMRLVTNRGEHELPDYHKLRKLFLDLAKRRGMEFDNVFDWTVQMYLRDLEKHRNE